VCPNAGVRSASGDLLVIFLRPLPPRSPAQEITELGRGHSASPIRNSC